MDAHTFKTIYVLIVFILVGVLEVLMFCDMSDLFWSFGNVLLILTVLARFIGSLLKMW